MTGKQSKLVFGVIIIGLICLLFFWQKSEAEKRYEYFKEVERQSTNPPEVVIAQASSSQPTINPNNPYDPMPLRVGTMGATSYHHPFCPYAKQSLAEHGLEKRINYWTREQITRSNRPGDKYCMAGVFDCSNIGPAANPSLELPLRVGTKNSQYYHRIDCSVVNNSWQTWGIDRRVDFFSWDQVEASGRVPDPNVCQPGNRDNPSGIPDVTIWSFSGKRDEPESLATALRSKLISHVAFFVGNRVTSSTLDKPPTQEAIRIAKEAGVELILVRFLWQTQPAPESELSILLNADYYVGQIELLRQEANQIGAKFVALDTETYGPTALTTYFRSRSFTKEDYDNLTATIDVVVRRIGKVDFLLPAGSSRKYHPYIAIANLGKMRISEGTYYDREDAINAIKYPYEISGMYTNVTKENETHPWNRFFLPQEVFGNRASVWQRRQGLMIWPRETHADEVANMLADFAAQQEAN